MRDVRFKALPTMGPHPGHWTHASLEQFVLRLSPICYALVVRRIIPTLDALNAELLKGRNDKGMSGGTEWKPFTITEDEYVELREALLTNPRVNLQT
jgi:hypothetical protein